MCFDHLCVAVAHCENLFGDLIRVKRVSDLAGVFGLEETFENGIFRVGFIAQKVCFVTMAHEYPYYYS